VNYSYTDLLAQTPAEVDVCGQVATKSYGTDLRRIRNSQCLEDTPRNTAQNLGDKQSLDVLSGKEDGCKTGYTDKACHDGITVAETLRDPAIDEETNDLTTVSSLFELLISV
jgi:hypothetical protein